MPNIYTFVDYTGFLSEVFESDLNFAGTWRSTANYYRYDVVTYGPSRYVCTVANTNVAPPSELQFSANWSIIAFTSTGTGSSGTITPTPGGGASVEMVEDVYSLAYRAYTIALTGTDLPTPGAVDSWVMKWIGHTYNIARAGTNAANSADMWARDAFHIAVSGTNAANSAWGYAGQAWNIAVAGTNAAAASQAAANSAYSLAQQALYYAWQGTTLPTPGPGGSGSVPGWVMDWLAQTYNLSIAGTNAANAVDTTARIALNTAWAGTQAADAANAYAGQAWNIAVAGTNAANSADMWARDAFGLAVTGTNAADQAYSLATLALNTAWAGTTPGGGQTGAISLTVDGAGSPITTGMKGGYVTMPYSGTITGWTMLANTAGSAVVDVWKDSYSNFPPTILDTITGGSKPTLSAADKSAGGVSGWNANFTSGDVFTFYVDFAGTVALLTLSLATTKE
ncbi:MAG: hypothetical protein ACOYB3_01640 [Azonexus sp.]